MFLDKPAATREKRSVAVLIYIYILDTIERLCPNKLLVPSGAWRRSYWSVASARKVFGKKHCFWVLVTELT